MQVDYPVILLISVAAAHSLFLAAATYQLKKSKSIRMKSLWKLTLGDGVLFLAAVVVFGFLLSPKSVLTLLSGIVYMLVGAFVLAVEIPGYIFLSQYDEKAVRLLTKLRKNLVHTSYSFENLNNLKTTMSEGLQILVDEQLDSLVHEFIGSCERMKNVDRSFFTLVLTEITKAIRAISKRSKHPFPKLIDILSLAGLSFLLAQFLELLD